MKIDNIIKEELWGNIEDYFNNEKYTNAIVESMLYLSNLLREKSGLEEDGIKLVNKCFSAKNPKIIITKAETETDRNIQEGTANILRGLYQLVRNPRHHEKYNDTEIDAIQIILFINYLLSILDKSKSYFNLDIFQSIVFDECFVDKDDYYKLVIDKIPKRKLFEASVLIYRKKESLDINRLIKLFIIFFKRFNENEKNSFIQIISDDLMSTNVDQEFKFILSCLPPVLWNKIDKLAKLRTENKILKSIEEGKSYDKKSASDGWLATWCTPFIKEFELEENLYNIVLSKILSDDISQIKYCMKYLFSPIFSKYSDDDLFSFINNSKDPWEYSFVETLLDKFKEELGKGNILYFDYINNSRIRKYFKNELNNFKENSDIPTISPDDYEDEIPF
jgi:uncharacterized protein (TIGR02391 family)